MMKYLKAAIRRWTVDSDTANPSLPSAAGTVLEEFTEGELVPFKGIMFRVARVVGGDHPILMLSPIGPTHGEKLRTMRAYRDTARAHLGRQVLQEKVLQKEWRRRANDSGE